MYFDAHSDIWTDVTVKREHGEKNVLKNHHLDRLRAGQVEGSIFVIWVERPDIQDYAIRTAQIKQAILDETAECDEVQIVHTVAEMKQARDAGKFYIWIGIEGMAAIGDDVSKVDEYYNFGCRHGMLTWNEKNLLGAGAATGLTDGLTEAGKNVVKRMQQLGMLVDTSHLNEDGFWDIVDIATAPIIASHSNCRALCDVPRNLTDEQLRAIRDLDGVVGLNSFTPFVHATKAKQTVEQLAKHADHMINIMGIEHVGCGYDFFEFCTPDVVGTMTDDPELSVAGMKDCSEIYKLFQCFDKLGLTKREKELIARENFTRVLEKTVG